MSGSWIAPREYSRIAVEGVLNLDSMVPLLAESPKQFGGKDSLEIGLLGARCTNSAGLALLLEWLELAHRQSVLLRFRDPRALDAPRCGNECHGAVARGG